MAGVRAVGTTRVAQAALDCRCCVATRHWRAVSARRQRPGREQVRLPPPAPSPQPYATTPYSCSTNAPARALLPLAHLGGDAAHEGGPTTAHSVTCGRRTDIVTAFELHTDREFGSTMLDNVHGPTLQEENGVLALYDEFNGKLWGLALGSIPRDVIKDPPKEVYVKCTRASFLEQYRHFREWVYGFRRLPYAA